VSRASRPGGRDLLALLLAVVTFGLIVGVLLQNFLRPS